jgi:hypothetical protein
MDLSHWHLVNRLTLEQAAHLAVGFDPNLSEELSTAQKAKVRLLTKVLYDAFVVAYRKAENKLAGLTAPPEIIAPDIWDVSLGELNSYELLCDLSDALEDPLNQPLPKLNTDRYPGTFGRDELNYWFLWKGWPTCYDFCHESSSGIGAHSIFLPRRQQSMEEVTQIFLSRLNKNSPTYPPELDAALRAWHEVSTTEGKGKPKARIRAWLDSNTDLSNEAKERIATVANWDKVGGASRTS